MRSYEFVHVLLVLLFFFKVMHIFALKMYKQMFAREREERKPPCAESVIV